MGMLRLAGRAGVGLVALGGIAIGGLYAQTQWRITRPAVAPRRAAPVIKRDSATLADGRRLIQANGCTDCHSASLGGRVMVDDPKVFRLAASNLTTGAGGVLARYDDAALDAAIRDGVGWDGRKLVLMPSHDFAGMADDHVAAIIGNIRSRPPVDNVLPEMSIGPIARGLLAADKMILLPNEKIDHQRTTTAVAPTGGTVEQGRYLAAGCTGCHQADYAGGPLPGRPPGTPPAANLTPAGRFADWSEAEFMTALRTGKRPDGSIMNAEMPWKAFSVLTDEEARAIHRYLRTLPAKPSRTE